MPAFSANTSSSEQQSSGLNLGAFERLSHLCADKIKLALIYGTSARISFWISLAELPTLAFKVGDDASGEASAVN